MSNDIVDFAGSMRNGFISVNNEFRRLGERLSLTFQEVDVGKQPNDSTGDTLRDSRDKLEHNFSTLGRYLGIELLPMPKFEPEKNRVINLGDNDYMPDIMKDCVIAGAVLHAANLNFVSLQNHTQTQHQNPRP